MAYGDLLKSLLGTQFDDYRNQIMADDPYSSSSAMFARALQPTGNTTNDLIGTGLQGLMHGFTKSMGQQNVNERLMPVYGALNQALMGDNVADLQTNPDLQRFAPTLLAIQAAQKQDRMEKEREFQQAITLEGVKQGMAPGAANAQRILAQNGIQWTPPGVEAAQRVLGSNGASSFTPQAQAQATPAAPQAQQITETDLLKEPKVNPAAAEQASRFKSLPSSDNEPAVIAKKANDRFLKFLQQVQDPKAAFEMNAKMQEQEQSLYWKIQSEPAYKRVDEMSEPMARIAHNLNADDELSGAMMILALVKMYDPTSVIRGTEVESMSESAQSKMDATLGGWRTILSNKSRLEPGARQRIYDQAANMWNESVGNYDQLHKRTLTIAEGQGLIPESIFVRNFDFMPSYAERLAKKQSETAATQSTGGDVNRDQVKAEIASVAKELGIKPELALKIAQTESNFNPNAKSPVGATGVYQLMPPTAKELGVDPTDPKQNIRGGLTYFKQLLTKYNGDEEKALAAYNWGMGNLAKASPTPTATWDQIKGKAPTETQNYVNKILGVPETKAVGGKYYKKVS